MISRAKIFILLVSIFLLIGTINGQDPISAYALGGSDVVNTITTAVPFLLIAPESRGGGMGDAGAATTPDVNSIHYNPAKLAFIDEEMGFSFSYTPWLRELIDDISLLHVTGFYKFNKNQVLAGSLRYFSLGNITFTDVIGNVTGDYNPNEFAFDVAYARLLSKNISGSIALRYIYSNLTGGQYVGGSESNAGIAVSSDISVYYRDDVELYGKDGVFALGANISNIGSKISYTENAEKDFIPANLKIGTSYFTQIDEYNSIEFAFDVNKLLVPSPPVYLQDENGPVVDDDGNQLIEFGMDPEVAVVSGIFQSFYDAPGVLNDGERQVWREEMREINYSIGVEYWYAKQFALRAGYFFEHPTKGNREFFTVGVGLKLNVFGLDFAYLVPTTQRHPLENTLRFSLKFDFEGFSQQSSSRSKVSKG